MSRKMKHYMNLQDEPFKMIKKGQKIYELRLNDAKRKLINIGDEIIFCNLLDKTLLYVDVLSILHYSTFSELYADLPSTEIGYQQDEVPNSADMLKYYPKEKEVAYGVVAIKIKVKSL